MKKTKLIMPIIGLTTITGSLLPLTAITSCSTQYNKVTLSEKTEATREVTSNAVVVLFQFKQENLKEHESTKVKLTNLKINGTDVNSVAGLLRFKVDSAGNINVYFNVSVAKQQYAIETASFDLVFTNKKANTEYTVTGFNISFAKSTTVEMERAEWWDLFQAYYDNFVNVPKLYNKMICTDDSYIKVTLDGTTTEVKPAYTTITYQPLSTLKASPTKVDENVIISHTGFFDKDDTSLMTFIMKLHVSAASYFMVAGGHRTKETAQQAIESSSSLDCKYLLDDEGNITLVGTSKTSDGAESVKVSMTYNKYSYLTKCYTKIVEDGDIVESEVDAKEFTYVE